MGLHTYLGRAGHCTNHPPVFSRYHDTHMMFQAATWRLFLAFWRYYHLLQHAKLPPRVGLPAHRHRAVGRWNSGILSSA